MLPTFIIEETAEFQLKDNENKDLIFFPSKFTDPWVLFPLDPSEGSSNPRFRIPGKDLKDLDTITKDKEMQSPIECSSSPVVA